MAKKLNAKQQAFVDEYLLDLNATQAGIRAGYSKSYAQRVCSTWVGSVTNCAANHLHIWEAIQKGKKARSERTNIDADYILDCHREINEMDFMDILNDDMSLKPLTTWPKPWRLYLTGAEIAELFEGQGDEREMIGILKKIKVVDKLKNLELMGKHVSVGAYSNRIDITPAEEFADVIKRRQQKKKK
ncbi:terminase small subunit [Vibrio harveyi]|uniref:terminase small subunit n=1 Tax=Vibrio harveyi TaxID=669 RepID=UPI00165D6AD5|nr:terminase small subunit [Vibrio harveyi]